MEEDLIAPFPANPQTVLVVGSQAKLREICIAICLDLGMEVMQASQGIHALKTLQKKKVDLLIAEWELPEVSGIALLSLVRNDDQMFNIPVLLLAGELKKEQVFEAGRAGVTSIGVLPLNRGELATKINEVYDQSQDPEMKMARQLFEEGLDLMRQERWEEAVHSFEQILEIVKPAEVYYNLGFIKTATGEFEEALKYFRQATEINHTFVLAYRKMAECFENLGQSHLAQKCLLSAADLYMDQDLDDEAEIMFNEVLRLKPDSINVFNSLGIIHRKRGEYEKAAAQYRRALKITPDDENIHYNLGRSYYEADMLKPSLEALESALQVNPDMKPAKELHKIIQEKLDDKAPKDEWPKIS